MQNLKSTYSDTKLVRPDFLIIGAMKSGTSTLWYHCRNHKSISIAYPEVHFFDQEENFKKGYGWYSGQLTKDKNSQTILFGEKTPSYGYMSKVAVRLRDYCPQVKLIWVFRNPVDRAYSHFLHARRKASEFYSFESALKREHQRVGKKDHLCYRLRSQYCDYVQQYLDLFDMNQMLFLKFEELVQNPERVLGEMFHFLSLSIDDFDYRPKQINKTVVLKYSRLRFMLRYLFGKNNRLYHLTSRICTDTEQSGYQTMSENTREQLLDHFYPYNHKLKELIDFDISGWEK